MLIVIAEFAGEVGHRGVVECVELAGCVLVEFATAWIHAIALESSTGLDLADPDHGCMDVHPECADICDAVEAGAGGRVGCV